MQQGSIAVVNSFWIKLPKKLQRSAAQWCSRKVRHINLDSPVISFTFDDFPHSALINGGGILHERGFSGTYYAAFGLMAQQSPTGQIFSREDLAELMHQEHELGCHTFDHCDSWSTVPSEFEASLRRNQRELATLAPNARFRSLSYPISWPRPETKRRIGDHYECARGGGQTFNAGMTDLNFLKAFFIEQSRDDFDAIRQTIEANARNSGWLIFATHDVCDAPTRFGCTPGLFEKVVDCAARSKAAILPVHTAFQRIFGNSSNSSMQ